MSDGITDAFRNAARSRLEAKAYKEMILSNDDFKVVHETVEKLDKLNNEIYDLKFALQRIRTQMTNKYIDQNDLQDTNT